MRDLDNYYKLFDFYISNIIYTVISKKELNEVISDIKSNHGLKSRDKDEIEIFLINEFFKKEIKDDFFLYSFRDKKIDILDISSTASRTSIFSYQTALYIHDLTDKLSLNIFLNKERAESKSSISPILEQEAVDASFNKDPRISTNQKKYSNYVITLLSGQFHNGLGMIDFRKSYLVTDIERTLIDCVVRPFYSGGAEMILKAFKNAKGTLDIKKLLTDFSKMNFIYPYHQTIGFYLEKSGYDFQDYEPFFKFGIELKFYLEYNIQNKAYSNEWHLYFPKEIEEFFENDLKIVITS